MKRFLLFFVIFFWTMIFPEFAFNSFTTDITSENLSYTDLYNKEKRAEIIRKADFDFKLF